MSMSLERRSLYLDSSLRVGKPLQMDIEIILLTVWLLIISWNLCNGDQIGVIRFIKAQCAKMGYYFIISMINVDFSSLSQYRSDGRKSSELRSTKIQLGVDAQADGSCLLHQGLTEVLCLVNGPYQRPANSDALLKIDYTVAPFSSLQRRRGKNDRDFTQFTENVRKSFEGVIVSELYKKHQIEISVTVIQNQGSAKSAVMNCISMALVNAGVGMRDLLVSCTVGMIGSRVLVDPNEEEEYEIVNEFVISYLRQSKSLDCVELRKAKMREEGLKELHATAVTSCQELYGRLRKALLSYSVKKMLIF